MNLSPRAIYETSSTQDQALGLRYQDPYGRVFRYTEAGGTGLDPGKLVVQADAVSDHVDISVNSDAAIDDTEVEVTLGSTKASADDYKDGWVVVQDGTGEGRAYRIEGHPEIASSGTGVITLAEPIKVALDSSDSKVDLIKNLYKDVQISNTDQADLPIGVPVVSISADEFGWVQTWGPCAVWQDEANAIGDMLTTGTGAAGQVEAHDAVGEPLIGMQGPVAGVATEYELVYLMLSP